MKGALAPLLMAAAVAVTPALSATTDNYQRDRERIPDPDAIEVAAPDTTGFWYYIRRGDLQQARREVARLQELAPGWAPDADMLAALAPDPAPEAEPAVDPVAAAHAALMRRLVAMDAAQRADVSPQTLERAIRGAESSAAGDELLFLAWIALARNAPALAERLLDRAREFDPALDVADARRQTGALLLERALADADIEALDTLLAADSPLAADAIRERILGAAWARQDAGDHSTALAYFRRAGTQADASLGTALALRALDRQDEALQTACRPPLLDEQPTLCRDWLGETLVAAWNRGQAQDSVAIADQLDSLGLLTDANRELRAWALYRLGDAARSRQEFSALLDREPDREDLAEALLATTEDAPRAREALADRHPLVRQRWQRRQADSAFGRKQFDLALRLGEPALSGRDGLEIGGHAHYRLREGDSGLSELVTREGGLAASALSGDWRWGLTASHTQLDQGGVEPGSWFGTAPVGTDFPGQTHVGEPGLRLDLEKQTAGRTLYLGVAQELRDQPANASWTAQLSATLYHDTTTTALSLFHRYREDSFLSRAGNQDLRAAEPWGGALATGFRGLHARSLGNRWTASLSGQFEQIDGENLEDNRGGMLRLDLVREHGDDRLDYWRSGGFISHMHYDENLNDYSLGHGGYFSPDRFSSIGISTELLTPEGHTGQVKLAASVAYSVIEQADYWRFPRSETGERVAGDRQRGLSGQLTLQAQRRLSPSWRVGAFVHYLEAIEFRAFAGGLTLHWSAARRTGSYSRDLPLEQPWIKGFAL